MRERGAGSCYYSDRQGLAVGAFPAAGGRGAGPSLVAEPADLVALAGRHLLRGSHGGGLYAVLLTGARITGSEVGADLLRITGRSVGSYVQHVPERCAAGLTHIAWRSDRNSAPGQCAGREQRCLPVAFDLAGACRCHAQTIQRHAVWLQGVRRSIYSVGL
jgi:hypothetical protein